MDILVLLAYLGRETDDSSYWGLHKTILFNRKNKILQEFHSLLNIPTRSKILLVCQYLIYENLRFNMSGHGTVPVQQ